MAVVEDVLGLAPSAAAAHQQKGEILCAMNKQAEAKAEFLTASHLNPSLRNTERASIATRAGSSEGVISQHNEKVVPCLKDKWANRKALARFRTPGPQGAN